jgi:hypothetical protein
LMVNLRRGLVVISRGRDETKRSSRRIDVWDWIHTIQLESRKIVSKIEIICAEDNEGTECNDMPN